LFVLLPLFVTVWVLYFLFRIINRTVTPWVIGLLRWTELPMLQDGWVRLLAPVFAMLLTAAVICVFGILARDVFGRRLLRAIDALFLRVPVIKGVYGSARQLMDAFTAAGTEAFRQVVLVEYPRKGLYAVGFSTGDAIKAVSGLDREDLVTIFLPTTPNPTSGMMIVVPRTGVQVLPMTVEEGLKLIVSGGIVVPQR
jgi:uncharacterized membrane protein